MTIDHGMADRPEFRRIEAFVQAANAPPGEAVRVGVGDDAAVVEIPAGETLVVSSDLSVEGVHFRRAWLTWEEIGYRVAAAALSDMAAMAATPRAVLVSAAVPPEIDHAVYESLGAGVGDCLRAFDAALIGGDLSRSPGPVMIDVTVLGTAVRPALRSGATPGQEVWVTGRLGGSGVAAAVLGAGGEPDPLALEVFKRPIPRIPEARWLIEHTRVGAMIDLSDGLEGDAAHVAAASRVRLVFDLARIPLHPSVVSLGTGLEAMAFATGGGEDYELLFTADPGSVEDVRTRFEERFGVDLTSIGAVESGEGVGWTAADGGEVGPPGTGYDHFADAGV